MSVITWALSHIPQLIFLIVLLNVVRAIVRAAKASQEHQSTASESDEQRRVREIQERIRKKIAERRGGLAPSAPTSADAPAPLAPLMRPKRTAPIDPFGGPSRPTIFEPERRAPLRVEPPPVDVAALERQEQLAEQMRALEEARAAALRRAAQVAAQRENAAASSRASSSHADWLGDLRDPHALRRAFVLREVLGAPVALR